MVDGVEFGFAVLVSRCIRHRLRLSDQRHTLRTSLAAEGAAGPEKVAVSVMLQLVTAATGHHRRGADFNTLDIQIFDSMAVLYVVIPHESGTILL